LSFPLEAIVGGRLPPTFEARDSMCSRVSPNHYDIEIKELTALA
jgi:hypothetical protein